ncbi:hypothetical protein D3C87_1017800 [compost metagenome]
MKKDLLTTLSFFSFLTLITYSEKPLKSSRRLKILLVLVLSIFYTTSKAQTLVHSVPTSNPSFPLPAGMDVVTVEAWGAGGAGGAANLGGGLARGAAGGSGGAYAKGQISGLNAQTLNVVVGAATAGGTGNGANGNPSYITGHTSVFYVPGGRGGTANLASGSAPAGVLGGSGAIGSISTLNGGSSGGGSNSLLSLGLSSGSGGNGANYGSGGGLGGVGVASLLGANEAGKPGGEYGGGGAGGASSSSLQNGGAGARGHVNITYTCKTYSFTSISAPNICTGTTSQVLLTGTAASLPAGTYTVTYNTSQPNAVGQTAPMVITTPGSGSFIASGLNVLGSSTITVTSLTSVDCTSPISAPNSVTITVSAPPTITLGSTTAVCASASLQNVALPYTTVTNAPTNYSITWNASPANNFLPVTNATLPASPISIAVPAGTAAGTYTGSLTVSNAAGCVSTAPTNFTITVNSAPAITTSGNLIPVCQSVSLQTASLPYSATTGTPINYSIDWATLNDQGITAFSFNSGGGNINNINVPANAVTGIYSGVMTIFSSNGCSTTQAVSLIINDLPTISTAGIFTPVCQSSSAQTTTLSYNSTTGSPVSYEIDWIALTDQGATAFPFSSGSGDIINVDVPANTTSGTYNGIMTITTSSGCLASQNVSLTVNPVSVAPTASVTQQPTCVNNTGVITVSSPASGTGYTYSVDGVDFSNTSGIFTGLSSGAYNVQVKNTTTGCQSEVTPITINASITKVWNGNVDANWGNAANWAPTGVPVATDCIEILDVAVNPVVSGTDGSFFASRLTIQNNASLIVEETNSITVTNEVSVLGNGVLIFENNSSLVQIADVANVGNITYRRKTSVRRFDLTFWSSPVAGVTMNEFSPETLFDKYSYWSSEFKWATSLYGTMEMEAGRGYSIRGPQSFATGTPSVFSGEFIGVPNNGTIQGPPAAAEKFCFFGNPYPSAIYADLFIRDNAANFYGTLFFWTHNTPPRITVPGTNTYRYTSDDYAIYNLSGDTSVGNLIGTGAESPGNQTPPKGYIAAGQAFFAKARTGQRGVFTNSMRVPSNNSQFYKSALVVEKHRVWLNLTNTQGAFKQVLIGYITGATNSFDFNYDAVTLNGNPYVDFYSINEGNKLVIQGRAVPFVVTDTIPLGYKSTIEKGDFTIAIDHTDGDLSTQDIYLEDKVTHTVHNLKSGGYTFTSVPGTFLDRFILRYKNPNEDKSLGNEDFENQNQKIFVSVKDKNIKLQSVSEQENLQEVAIYDVGGKLLYNKKQIENREWLIPNFQSGPQILLVKITLENGQKVTRKIVFR